MALVKFEATGASNDLLKKVQVDYHKSTDRICSKGRAGKKVVAHIARLFEGMGEEERDKLVQEIIKI